MVLRRWSVRRGVTVLATAGVLLVLLAVSALLLVRQRAALVENLDDTLYAEAERLAGVLEADHAADLTSGDDRVVIVLDERDRPVHASLDGEPAEPEDAAAVVVGGGREVMLKNELWRVVSYRFPSGDGLGTVYLGGEFEDVNEGVAELRRSLVWIVPVATMSIGLLVWVLAGWTMRPVERIRQEVAGIGPTELGRRVEVPPSGDEVSLLAATMNDMLDRLQDAADRQERFVADASHELRTPLSRMRAELEADEQDPASADADASRRSQLEEIATLQTMIEDLLLLAEGEADTRVSWRPVDLDDIVADEIRRVRSHVPDIEIDAAQVSGAQVDGNADHLRRVVRNLLDNACRHASSRVSVEVAERGDVARVAVTDDGPGVPHHLVPRLFERFSRLEESRPGGDGTGLGLAIVSDIVRRHHGEVTVHPAPGGGTSFVVSLPLSSASR